MMLKTRFDLHAKAIAALPDRSPLTKADLLLPTFRLHQEATRKGLLEIYYSPIDVVNAQAKIALIGICPAFAGMRLAYEEASQALRAGQTPEQAQERAKRRAQWAGQTRVNLIAMLDALGLPARVDAPDGAALFHSHAHLLHSSAVIRYPVFLNGSNYSGYAPDMLQTPVLRHYIETTLPEELEALGKAVIILLGRSAFQAAQMVAGDSLRKHDRLVLSLPHPSAGPGNRQRKQQFADHLPELKAQIAAWFSSGNTLTC